MTKILSFLGWAFINLLNSTLRVRKINSFVRSKQNAVFAFWHGEQFLLNIAHKNTGAVLMSSLSKDGEIQAGILGRFKYKIVRGSSTRRAERALVEMMRLVKRGNDAGFAVDGPKGPYKEAKSGVIYLAQKCGIPIVPISCCAKYRTVFSRAWDRYELPKPFSPAVAVYGKPLEIGKSDDIEKRTAELSKTLQQLSRFSHESYWSSDVREYLANHPSPKILIIQPSRIGDLVFAGPSVHAIRKKYPNAWIGWITDERCAPIIEGSKDIDEVIIFDRGRLSPGYIFKTARYLRSKNIDLSIDFHSLAKSAFFVHLAGARFKLASSSTNGMREFSWLFSKEIKAGEPNAHCIDRHYAVAEYLGCNPQDKNFTVEVSQEDSAKVEGILLNHGLAAGKPFAVIHPGGGWISRRWFPERYAELINRIEEETGIRTVLVGGKEGGADEKGLNEEILEKVRTRAIDLTGKLTLKELTALLKKSGIFIANEAGPMHIASSLNVPSLAILGPTDPSRTGPYGGRTKIIRHQVHCQPCRERNCASKECMKLVTVDEVFDAVKEKLNI